MAAFRQNASSAVRRLLLLALGLTLIALIAELNFLLHTTGGTLFVFTTASPACILLAVSMLIAAGIVQYRRQNKLFEIERHPAGATILRQGEIGDCAYFIQGGEVEVVREPDGDVLATLGAGDYFGEMAILSDEPRNATVRCLSDVEVAVVGKRHFLNILRLLPESEDAVMSTVRDRVLRG